MSEGQLLDLLFTDQHPLFPVTETSYNLGENKKEQLTAFHFLKQ